MNAAQASMNDWQSLYKVCRVCRECVCVCARVCVSVRVVCVCAVCVCVVSHYSVPTMGYTLEIYATHFPRKSTSSRGCVPPHSLKLGFFKDYCVFRLPVSFLKTFTE